MLPDNLIVTLNFLYSVSQSFDYIFNRIIVRGEIFKFKTTKTYINKICAYKKIKF